MSDLEVIIDIAFGKPHKYDWHPPALSVHAFLIIGDIENNSVFLLIRVINRPPVI